MMVPAPIRRAIAEFIALEGQAAALREAMALPAILAAAACLLAGLAAVLES
tara:strand:- start:197 stop:349 length:153 start_codon:yes stop_codon:yes gene_type:complete